jgi:hypothetical protein
MNSVLYKRKDARQCALVETVRKMGLENFTTEDAKQKIKSLRAIYQQESHKIDKSLSSGAGLQDVNKPSSDLQLPGINSPLSLSSMSTEPLGSYVPIALFVNQLCRAHTLRTILSAVVTLQAIDLSNTRNRLTRIPNPFSDILLALDSL